MGGNSVNPEREQAAGASLITYRIVVPRRHPGHIPRWHKSSKGEVINKDKKG